MSTHNKAEEDPNGSAPAFPLALPLEIWMLVGEQVRSCIWLANPNAMWPCNATV